jgi:hypothetical protein
MLIPFGILSAAGAGGDYELIETSILASNTFSVTFSNLANYSSVYKHLQLRVSVRSVANADGDNIKLRFNNDATTANYYYHSLFGTGSIVGSESANNISGARFMQASASTFTANAFNAGVCDIVDAFAAKTKTLRTFSGLPGTYNRVWFASNLWNSTAAVTSIYISTDSGANFLAGSRFSLYGIKG